MVLPEEEKEKIENALNRMQSRQVMKRTKERESDALRDWKKEEEKKRGEGKKEFYLKKGSSWRFFHFILRLTDNLNDDER